MAGDVEKIFFGSGVFSIGAYVTAGGAGTLTDVGYTEGPVALTIAKEAVEVEADQETGVMRRVITKLTGKLKVPMKQGDLEKYRVALSQPAGNLTGVAPNQTLAVGKPTAEQYHQASLVTKGPGTTGTRTITFWKLWPEAVDEIPFAKGAAQAIPVTFDVLLDVSVATSDKYFKAVDS